MSSSFTSAPEKSLASMSNMLSKFSAEPPSQYWKLIMKERASLALSEGRYFNTLGSVRSSLSMPSSKEEPFCFLVFFIKSPMTLLL